MRNLKKLLAVVVAICVLATMTIPAFAAETKTDAQICEALGVLKGDGAGVTDTYLAKGTNRMQAAQLYLRLIGLEDEALAELSTDNFDDAKLVYAGGQRILAYLKANPDLGWNGVGGNKFEPTAAATAQMIYKVLLEAMGYKMGVDFEWADTLTFAADKGLSKIADVTSLTNNDMATAIVEALNAKVKGSDTTLLAKLIADGVIDEAAAEAAGLTKGAVALDVSGAVAINSKVVEVTLGTAAAAKDLQGITVADSAAKDIAVSKIEFAPWSSDNKTVLVTLGADTVSGTLYTLTAGEKKVNFGGKAADTGKPDVSGVVSTDYNQVKVTFDEPVLIGGAKFAIAEKYGTKAALEISGITYGSSTEILLATADQKEATLYGIEITGATDLAGNTMDKDDDKTFQGTKKNDSDLKVTGAYGLNNPEEVTVQFNVRVDAATIAPENFKVEEMYGTKAVLPVTAAKLSAKDETVGVAEGTIVDDINSVHDAKKNVVLTVPGLKDSTLYKVTVSGMSSAYGKALSSKDEEKSATFSAMKKPSDPFKYSVVDGVATSNTTVTIEFDNKVVKEEAENIANYAIAEAYGSKAALAVTKAELQTGDKKVKLTVAAMQTVLYKLTVTGIHDIYGNAIKTESDANIVSFSGKGVAPKISSVTADYVADSSTVLLLTFNQNVGNSATDVAHYTIDNSVGYPEKAAKGDNANEVKLTIPKLTPGKTYKVTVKGLENADGVAMDSDGVSATFVGKGDAAGDPELVAVMPIDNQTIKVYFNRDVTDSSIKGQIWDKDNKELVVGALSYLHGAAATTDLASTTEYAYQDPETASALIIRIDTNDAFKYANRETTLNAFKLVGDTDKFKENKNSLVFATKEDEPAAIEIEGVLAINKRTVRVHFSQPVYGSLVEFAKIDTAKGTAFASAAIEFENAVAIDSTKKVYDFKTDTDLTNAPYWLIVDPSLTAGNTVIKDVDKAAVNGYVTLKDEDTGTAGLQQFRQFAGSAAAAGDIKDIQVIMTDNKSIKVYFPQLMDESAVEDPTNYWLVDKDGAAIIMTTGSGVAFDNTADIGEIVYESKDNTAVITLNKTVKTIPTGGVFLKLAKIFNATQTAQVKDGDNNITKQFAVSTTDSAKVKLSSASYSTTDKKLTIEFNMQIKTNANVVGDEAALLAILSMNMPGFDAVDASEIHDVTALKADETAAANTATTFIKKIVVEFESNPTPSKVGKAKIASAAGFIGINGNGGDTDSEVPFAQ